MADPREDAPECRDCAAHCCVGAVVYIGLCPEDVSYIGQLREAQRTLATAPEAWVQTGPARHQGWRIAIPFECPWFENGRCAAYAARPEGCREYPSDEEIAVNDRLGDERYFELCALARRLRGEGKDADRRSALR